MFYTIQTIYRVSLKKGNFSDFCLVFVLEVGFYFFTCVLESEFRARFIQLLKLYPFRIPTALKTQKSSEVMIFIMFFHKCEVVFHIWEIFFHGCGMHSTFLSNASHFHKIFTLKSKEICLNQTLYNCAKLRMSAFRRKWVSCHWDCEKQTT